MWRAWGVAMLWAIIYRDKSNGKIMVHRGAASREQCLIVARALSGEGHEVHAMVGPNAEVIPLA